MVILTVSPFPTSPPPSHEHRKKRPTKKVDNRFPPTETNVAFRQGRLARPKKRIVGPNWAPIQRIFDLTDACFSRRHARHDSGVETALATPI